jgi:two-component system chemotaxis response regulator CheB
MRSGNRYACFVGHSYSPESLLDAKQDDLERALWTAVRTLEETAVLQRHLADKISAEKGHRLRSHFSSKARENDQSAQRIRRMIAPGTGQPRSDFSSS